MSTLAQMFTKQTLDSVAALLNRCELKNPPFNITWWVFESEGAVFVQLVASIKERDSGEPTTLRANQAVDLYLDDTQLLMWFEDALRTIFLHEFEEAFHIDGKRYFDPHANGESKAGGYYDKYRDERRGLNI